jgi:hypothetical protein
VAKKRADLIFENEEDTPENMASYEKYANVAKLLGVNVPHWSDRYPRAMAELPRGHSDNPPPAKGR